MCVYDFTLYSSSVCFEIICNNIVQRCEMIKNEFLRDQQYLTQTHAIIHIYCAICIYTECFKIATFSFETYHGINKIQN